MSEGTTQETAVSITVDGKEVEAKPGELVIDAAERHGVYIPRFCYHNRMRPVGMCRMCIVDIDTGRGPGIQPACMVPVSEGMTVVTDSERIKKAQDGVLEFLLINHPLDCPVCDKGGECPLQDQTIAYGPGESRFVEEKRHYPKPIPISEVVYLDRERCILCDRCTRFADEVAGDPLISFIGRGSYTQVNTFPDEPFSSYFSGNTVQICPVGALTAKPYRFRARPWDLQEVPSTCQGCAVGCSMTIQSSRNKVLRYLGVDNDHVNWSWLCDRGRFDFEAVNSEDRLAEPLLRREGELAPATWASALSRAAATIRDATAAGGSSAVGVIGGAHETNESQYAWAKLAKGVIGTDNVDCQVGDGLPAEVVLGLPRATIREACEPGGTIVVVAPDPKEVLPVLFLRLRHAAVADGATLIEVAHGDTGLTRYASASLRARPGEVADVVRSLLPGGSRAELVPEGRPVTVVLGRTSVTEPAEDIAAAAAALAAEIPNVRFLPALWRANTLGGLDTGLAPGLLPGRVGLATGSGALAERWPSVPDQPGADTAGMLRAAAEGTVSVLVLLGSDVLAEFPDRALAERALERATVIALDRFLTPSAATAEVVLPVAGYAEVNGTTTNVEGRVLPVAQKVTPPGTARAAWMIAAELAFRLSADLGLDSEHAIFEELRQVSEPHGALSATVGYEGTVVEGSAMPQPSSPDAGAPPDLAPTELRLVVTNTMYDGATATQRSPSIAGLAPRSAVALNPEDFGGLGVEPGQVVRVTSVALGASVDLPAWPDPGVVRSTARCVSNLPDAELNRLLSADGSITDVRVERI